jgi:hypothetical protein
MTTSFIICGTVSVLVEINEGRENPSVSGSGNIKTYLGSSGKFFRS